MSAPVLENVQTRLADWMADSSQFAAFVSAHRAKIRAKLHHARSDSEDVLDVLWEFQVARLLLMQPDVRVEYEPYDAGQRAPDFRACIAGETFEIEAARIRATPPRAET